jgi:hypothetical protein
MALVHLYVQGYDGETLTNFELSLTTPSVVYEQEKIALWKEKIDLAKNMLDTSLIPSDWIYDKIFQLSEDVVDDLREQVIEDKKRTFRLAQIENEGNDPAKTGKSFGTPHDLAALYGKGRMGNGDVPAGYDEKVKGRPLENVSFIGTQADPLGRDRLGRKEFGTTGIQKMANDSDSMDFKGGSPLALSEYLKNKKMLESLNPFKKITLFEGKDQESGLLDDRQLKDI